MRENLTTGRLLSAPGAPLPVAPAGFITCVTGYNPHMSHLVAVDAQGNNGGRPTVCGLTRFDQRDKTTGKLIRRADLPGWGLGGGVSGPTVVQERCTGCWPREDRS